MSDYSTAVRHLNNAKITMSSVIDAYNKQKVSASHDSASIIKDFDLRLQALKQQSQSWAELFKRIESRLEMIDPVTKEPRYGPKMADKVKNLMVNYNAFREQLECSAIVKQIETQAMVIHDLEAQASEIQKNRREALERELSLAQQKIQNDKWKAEEVKAKEEMEREKLRNEEIVLIAAKAEALRAARRDQAQKEKLAAQAEEARIQRQIESIRLGKDGLQRALEIFERNFSDQNVFVDKMKKLHLILSTICSSPEKVEYRTLSKANAYLDQDFGQYEGGYLCFTALGFVEADSDSDEASLYLEEPDINVDMDAWSSWFENLKECKAYLETRLFL